MNFGQIDFGQKILTVWGMKTKHRKLLEWVSEVAALCQPDRVEWADGSRAEYDRLMQLMVDAGMATKLNEKKRPDSFLFRSDPSDVARVENRTFIACANEDEAGPTNNWMEPAALKRAMTDLYRGCMQGRTMYVIPFAMGPLDSLYFLSPISVKTLFTSSFARCMACSGVNRLK